MTATDLIKELKAQHGDLIVLQGVEFDRDLITIAAGCHVTKLARPQYYDTAQRQQWANKIAEATEVRCYVNHVLDKHRKAEDVTP